MTQNTEQNVWTREEQLRSLMGVISPQAEYPLVADLLSRHLAEAEARGAEEQRRKDAKGYLFENPDTGTEYLPYHPVESGECPYAENIREATSTELLSALIASWQGWKEDRDEKEKISSTVAALGRDLNDWRSRFWKADNERVRYRECMTDCVALLNRIKSGGLTRIWLKNCLEESPQDTGEE